MSSCEGDRDFEANKCCRHCNKKVVSAWCCTICASPYHRSCAFQAKLVNKENNVICCKPHGKSEVSSSKEEMAQINVNNIEEIISSMLQKHLGKLKNDLEKCYKKEIKELKAAIQFMSDSVDEHTSKITEMLEKLRNVEEENDTLKTRVVQLEDRLNMREQESKENNIIISGIEGQQYEPKVITQKILTTMRVELQEDSIVECRRISKKPNSPLLVAFKNKADKLAVFRKRKELRSIKCADCGLVGNKHIYFNDDLIVEYQNLFKKVRELKKQRNYNSAYCVGGRIYLVKHENDRPIRIFNERDLSAH